MIEPLVWIDGQLVGRGRFAPIPEGAAPLRQPTLTTTAIAVSPAAQPLNRP